MIEIIEYKPINQPSLKAQVSIRLPKWGGFIIKRIKVFQKDNSRWLTLPSEEYERDGKKKFFPVNEFDNPEMMEAFRKSFFSELDKYLQSKNLVS